MKNLIVLFSILSMLIVCSCSVEDEQYIEELGYNFKFERLSAFPNRGMIELGNPDKTNGSIYCRVEFSFGTMDAPDFFIINDTTLIVLNYNNLYDIKTINNGFNLIINDAMQSYEYPNSTWTHTPGTALPLAYSYFKSFDYIYQYFNHIGVIDSSDFGKPMYWISILESCRGYEFVNLKTVNCMYEYYYD